MIDSYHQKSNVYGIFPKNTSDNFEKDIADAIDSNYFKANFFFCNYIGRHFVLGSIIGF